MQTTIKTIVSIDAGIGEESLFVLANDDDTLNQVILRMCDQLEYEEEDLQAALLRALLIEGTLYVRGKIVSKYHKVSMLPWHSFQDNGTTGAIVNVYISRPRSYNGAIKCTCPFCGDIIYTDQRSCEYCNIEVDVSDMEVPGRIEVN